LIAPWEEILLDADLAVDAATRVDGPIRLIPTLDMGAPSYRDVPVDVTREDASLDVVSIFYDGTSRKTDGEYFDMLTDFIKNKTEKRILIDEYSTGGKSLKALSKNSDASRSLKVVNAGGRSGLSEMLSIQYFCGVHSAKDVILEMEIEYWIDYKMVDFVCSVDGERIGVSVTRAMGYPTADEFTIDKARSLLDKKLYGLVVARNAVVKKHRFFKSVLHIWCQTPLIAEYMKVAYDELLASPAGDESAAPHSYSDLLVILTTFESDEIYCKDYGIYSNF
jgi:hypothetical protein